MKHNALAKHVKYSKAQIPDLVALRDQIEIMEKGKSTCLMVFEPERFPGAQENKKHLTLVNEAFEELHWEVSRVELEVKKYDNPILAASDICSREVALN